MWLVGNTDIMGNTFPSLCMYIDEIKLKMSKKFSYDMFHFQLSNNF